MFALDFHDLSQHSDVLRLRSGQSVAVRFVEPQDAPALQDYFRSLSSGSRYSRFLGALSELPQTELEKSIHVGEDNRFTVIAIMRVSPEISNSLGLSRPSVAGCECHRRGRDGMFRPHSKCRRQSLNAGGGTKPPNSCSISAASFSDVRSSSHGPTIWTPSGRPSLSRPSGIAVAGSPGSVAMPGHTS